MFPKKKYGGGFFFFKIMKSRNWVLKQNNKSWIVKSLNAGIPFSNRQQWTVAILFVYRSHALKSCSVLRDALRVWKMNFSKDRKWLFEHSQISKYSLCSENYKYENDYFWTLFLYYVQILFFNLSMFRKTISVLRKVLFHTLTFYIIIFSKRTEIQKSQVFLILGHRLYQKLVSWKKLNGLRLIFGKPKYY